MIQQAIALSKKYEREASLAYYLSLCHATFIMMGKFKESIEVINEALSIRQKMKVYAEEADCLSRLVLTYFYLGSVEKSLLLLNSALEIEETIHHKNVSNSLSILQNFILKETGNYNAIPIIVLDEVVENIITRGEWGRYPHIHLVNTALIYLEFDKIDNAFQRLKQVKDYFQKYYIKEGFATLYDAYAQVYLAQGDLAKAETSLNEAIALFQHMHSFRLGEADLTLAALRLAQGNPSAALTAAQNAARIFTEIEYYRRGEARLWEAKCQLALRNAQAVRACLADANATFARQQQPHHAAEAKLVEGQLLLAESGDKAQALTFFNEAKATFAELGLKRLEKEAIQLLARENPYA